MKLLPKVGIVVGCAIGAVFAGRIVYTVAIVANHSDEFQSSIHTTDYEPTAPRSGDGSWRVINAWPGDRSEKAGDVMVDGLTYERCLAAKDRWQKADPSSSFGCTNL